MQSLAATVQHRAALNTVRVCWQVRVLLVRSRQQVLQELELLLPALFDALSGGSDRVVLEALSVQVASAVCNVHAPPALWL